MPELETPTPAAEPVSGNAHDDRPDTANYDELVDHELGIEPKEPPSKPEGVSEPMPAAEPKTPPAEPPVAAAAQPTPVAQPTPAAVPAPVQQPPPQPAAAPPATEPPKPSGAVPTAEDIKRERDNTIQILERSYAFNEAEAAELVTNPEKVLPRIAARLHMNVFETVLQVLGQQLPNFIRNYSQAQTAQDNNWKAFVKEWPELDKPEYYPVIAQAAQMYRGLNTQAKLEDYVRDLGPMLMMRFGLSRVPPAAVAAAPPAPRPHTPANPGGSASSAPQRGQNEYEILAREFEDLDRRG